MFFAQACRECCKQVLRRHVDLVTQPFGRLLELGKIVAVGLDQVAHALDRVGLEAGALVAVGHLGRDQRFAAAGFGIGGVQPL